MQPGVLGSSGAPKPSPEGLLSAPAWLHLCSGYCGHRESSWLGRYVMDLSSPMKPRSSAKAGGNALHLRAGEAARVGAAQGQAGAFLIYEKRAAQRTRAACERQRSGHTGSEVNPAPAFRADPTPGFLAISIQSQELPWAGPAQPPSRRALSRGSLA